MIFFDNAPQIHDLILVGLLVLSICMVLVCLNLLRIRQIRDVETLDTKLNALTCGAHSMGQKLLLLEKKFIALQSVQEEMKQGNMDFSYSTAQKLLEEGIDDRSIAANSGLSSTEISLMRMLHSQERRLRRSHV